MIGQGKREERALASWLAYVPELALVLMCVALMLSLGRFTPAWADDNSSSQDGVTVQEAGSPATAAQEAADTANSFGVHGDHVRLQLFSTQQILGLPINNASYYFKVPGQATFGTVSLGLHITSSDTLFKERSSIGVSINGNEIETVPTKSIGTDGNGWLNVNIPAEYIKSGAINELSISDAHRSIDGDCADIDNPSNWVAIEPSSFLDLQVEAYPAATLSNVFDRFYDSIFAGTGLSANFVLANNGDQSLLSSSALTLASAAGAYKEGPDVNFTADASQADASHSIFLGWQDDWASQFSADPLPSLSAGQGYLEAAGSTGTQDDSRLLVSGADEDGLKRAVALASSSAYLKQIAGSSSVVTSDVDKTKQPDFHDNGVYTFDDLGYKTVSLAGAFHQESTFTVAQPDNMQCGPASTVTINFSHSKALQADRSLLTVKIDDTEVDSVQLSDSNATNGSITVPIPDEARDKPSIKITVEVYNYIGKVDCSKNYYDVAWTVIDGSSSVFFDPSDMRLRPKLSDFLQFNLWKESPDDTVVLHSAGLSDLSLDVAGRVGQNNGTALNVSSASLDDPLQDRDKDNNAIYLGSVSDLQLPDEVQDALDAVPQSDGTYRIADGVPVISESLAGKVVFQVVRSPWNYDKYIYVISYPDGQEDLAKNIIKDKNILGTLSGTISSVDDEGVVSSYDAYAQTEGEEAPLTLDTLQYKVQKQFGIPLWWLVAGIVALIVLIVLIIRLGLRRAQFKKMEQKMKEANRELDGAEDKGAPANGTSDKEVLDKETPVTKD